MGAATRSNGGGVLVGTDGSAGSWTAIREAAAIARSRGAELHVVAAYGRDERHRDRAVGLLTRVEAELALPEKLIQLHAVPARPSRALTLTAERVGAALIVVGNRGVEDWIRIVQRPICEQVRRRAGCEVLVLDTSAHWRGRVDDPSLTPLTRAEPMVFFIEWPKEGWRLYVGGWRVHHGLAGELLLLDGLRRRSRFGLLEILVGGYMFADDWRDWPFALRE